MWADISAGEEVHMVRRKVGRAMPWKRGSTEPGRQHPFWLQGERGRRWLTGEKTNADRRHDKHTNKGLNRDATPDTSNATPRR